MVMRTPRIALTLALALAAACTDDERAVTTPAAAPAPAAATMLDVSASSLERGSLSTLSFTRRDSAPAFGSVDPAAIAIKASPGVTFSITGATVDRIDALVAVDASAPIGNVSLEIVAGATTHSATEAIAIVDGAPPAFVAATTTVTFTGESRSALLWIDPLAPLAFVEIAMIAPRPDVGFVLLEPDGRFSKDLSPRAGPVRRVIGAPRGLIVRDASRAPSPITLAMRRRTIREEKDVAKHLTIAEASVLGAPDVYVARMELAAGETHFYSVDVAAGAVGLRLRVETLPSALGGETDTRLAVFRDDQQTMLGAPSTDHDLLDALTTATIPSAGRHYIRVETGSAFDPAHAEYALLVTLE
jgi:hypothetical protein